MTQTQPTADQALAYLREEALKQACDTYLEAMKAFANSPDAPADLWEAGD